MGTSSAPVAMAVPGQPEDGHIVSPASRILDQRGTHDKLLESGIRLGKQEHAVNMLVWNLVVVRLAVQAQVIGVQLDVVSSSRRRHRDVWQRHDRVARLLLDLRHGRDGVVERFCRADGVSFLVVIFLFLLVLIIGILIRSRTVAARSLLPYTLRNVESHLHQFVGWPIDAFRDRWRGEFESDLVLSGHV